MNDILSSEDRTIIFITKYIAVWGWQLISINFLVSMLILYSFEKTKNNIIFIVVSFILFATCQLISNKKKKELLN